MEVLKDTSQNPSVGRIRIMPVGTATVRQEIKEAEQEGLWVASGGVNADCARGSDIPHALDWWIPMKCLPRSHRGP